jgi:hypothetical protein
MTAEELAIAHAESRGWNAALEAAATTLEHSAFYYVLGAETKLVPSESGQAATRICAAEIRKLDKSLPAIGD